MTVPILHSILQVRPNRTFYLNALKYSAVDGVWGLGLPGMTTQNELVLEQGVFQHGSTLTVVRLPATREWHMNFKTKADCTLETYYNARRELIDIFNPHALAGGDTSGTTPSLYVYSITLPDGRKFNIRFAYRSGLEFDEGEASDQRSFSIKVRLMSPDVTLYEDNQQSNIAGLTSAVGGPYNNIITAFTYAGTWDGRFRLEFQRTVGPAITTLYAIRLRDMTSPFDFNFQHVNYPAGGWTFAAVVLPQTFIFDSRRQIATYSDAGGAGNDQNLTLAAAPGSDWRMYRFYPGINYQIAIETDTAGQVVVGPSPAGLNYYPTHIGI